MTIQYTPKKAKGPQEPEGGQIPGPLAGIPHLRPKVFRRLNKSQRTVSRAYGGVLSHRSVRDRIVRAFLIEEVKLIKRSLARKKEKADGEQEKKSKKDSKKDAKKKDKGDKKKEKGSKKQKK